jgi:translation initiation factor 2B subunit (eIF-2B alpha/beta/delta family)
VSTTPDPLQSVIDLAQRVIDDAEKILKTATQAAHDMGDEGIGLVHDTANVVTESLQLAKNQLDKAAGALGQLGKGKPPA